MSQISLTFPDGHIREYAPGVTAAEVAKSIAPSLAKAAISAQVNGAHWDLAWPITDNAQIAINTLKDDAPALGHVGEVARGLEGPGAVDVAGHARAGGDRVDALGVH